MSKHKQHYAGCHNVYFFVSEMTQKESLMPFSKHSWVANQIARLPESWPVGMLTSLVGCNTVQKSLSVNSDVEASVHKFHPLSKHAFPMPRQDKQFWGKFHVTEYSNSYLVIISVWLHAQPPSCWQDSVITHTDAAFSFDKTRSMILSSSWLTSSGL